MAISFLRRTASIIALGVTTFLPMSKLAAQQSFFFQFTSGTTSASGNLSATSNGDGTYTATSGTGTVSGAQYDGAFTLFANPTPSGCSTIGPVTFDNLLKPGGDPLITNCGLFFTMDGGGQGLNIYAISDQTGSQYTLAQSTAAGGTFYANGTFTLTSTPEPSSMALLGTGLVGLVPLVRRKYKIG